MSRARKTCVVAAVFTLAIIAFFVGYSIEIEGLPPPYLFRATVRAKYRCLPDFCRREPTGRPGVSRTWNNLTVYRDGRVYVNGYLVAGQLPSQAGK